MTELTPEERQRIYLEEKTRLAARQQLATEKRTRFANRVGIAAVCFVGLLILTMVIGVSSEQSQHAALVKLTPAERRAQAVASCTEILRLMRFKLYSEMSTYERRMHAACTEQVEHPDEQVFEQSK